MQSTLYKKKKDITKNVCNECFIVTPESQDKKRKNDYMEKFLRYQNTETHE